MVESKGGVESPWTYLRSVTWTKVSLKEAKIRATPKTSSPVDRKHRISAILVQFVRVASFMRASAEKEHSAQQLTFTDLRAERDVLGGGALDLLLGCHLSN